MPTEPNAMDEGLAVSCPWVPLPDMATTDGEACALLVIETLPAALPGDVGAKVVIKEALAPGMIVMGVAAPLMLYPGPEIAIWLTVRFALPGFEIETVCDALLPTA